MSDLDRQAEALRCFLTNIEEMERQAPAAIAEIEREAREAEAAGRLDDAVELRTEAERVAMFVETGRKVADDLRKRGLLPS